MAEAVNGFSSAVFIVTSEMKASVPSLPTMQWAIMSKGSSKSTKGSRLRPVTFFMEYLYFISSQSSVSAAISALISSISARRAAWVRAKAARDSWSAVSSTVPSASTMRIERSVRSLLAWVPHFMPEALLATMPPTMADFFEAGSGVNTRWYGLRIWLTRSPMMPGWSAMAFASGSRIRYFSQNLPATRRMESEMACPDRLVPAARKVTGSPSSAAVWSTLTTSFSSAARTTTRGSMR